MIVDVKVPVFSESVSEGTLLGWKKQKGQAVAKGDVLIEIETDKVVLEVYAQESGVLTETFKNEGDTVTSEEVIAKVDTAATAGAGSAPAATPAAPEEPKKDSAKAELPQGPTQVHSTSGDLSPAVRKLVAESGVNPAEVQATGPKGNITKGDVLTHIQTGGSKPAAVAPQVEIPAGARPEQRVPMTRIRQTISKRLKEVQNTAAILTTFNEVDMKPIMDLRKKYQDEFVKKHGIKLGFMSFFVRAATEALKQYPIINASVDGNDIIYHGYYDIGIAVASERGLVVPILRNTDQSTLADIEKQIGEYAQKAKNGKLGLEDMTGGTFSITNGGTFGSMMSTPILNAPQSAILGMHNIIERPVAENGQVVIRPMMYIAMSYDHRIIDGREAVLFLVTIKKLLEDPARLLLDL
ncbi:2-oxoglutarate dehydrogenase complex dihydrolipoyllysine-residue succinyltransferase [Deinococcus cellulosilyticus]|uniref:Dihydrolipoyllysine-residue succinyltransferase component of 2-oxoglutarate dehydrogenase complex n=1 Tax=Deinococcus cellulosilyticus (strain DSM 18568 / NBRC 106333 / KACC 11606 / 5516J-15) TaxID=1223518 RepID=A0A511N989_DEIC1|nr:2-oxoglutarate dehydrogenase complex dihydrolipoyllysine-residue succinyltransferase [Deinococcus cellulosilyticus]GEM49402.1 dihydrolipoyllysine-residue succinyltransferase component of 2-oxoglutarate dehydrogenase complex [Deinococcus cellulosilyticus NBRC 106333 = KACC 11606]